MRNVKTDRKWVMYRLYTALPCLTERIIDSLFDSSRAQWVEPRAKSPKYYKIFQNVAKCFPKCSKIIPNYSHLFSKCSKKCQNVPKCSKIIEKHSK
jgi:hypothetical protein